MACEYSYLFLHPGFSGINVARKLYSQSKRAGSMLLSKTECFLVTEGNTMNL